MREKGRSEGEERGREGERGGGEGRSRGWRGGMERREDEGRG